MTRKLALEHIRSAGYHNDSAAFWRLWVENRVSKDAADKAWQIGQDQKRNGMRCSCFHCKNA
jgi:hypothetical protein